VHGVNHAVVHGVHHAGVHGVHLLMRPHAHQETASERRGNNFQGFWDFGLKAKVIVWL
jgi:hypothetical protein